MLSLTPNLVSLINSVAVIIVVEKTISAVHQFADGTDPADDITLLALRRAPAAGNQ